MSTRRGFIASSAALCVAPWTLKSVGADASVFKLFDGHLHLVADDEARYPRVPPGTPPPGAGPSGGGLPPGVGGQPGGLSDGAAKADTDVRRVLQWMEEQGVTGAAAVQKKGSYGFDNSYILDSAERYPSRFRAVVVLDAEDSKTPALVHDLALKSKLAGVRLTGAMDPDKSFPWLNSPQALKTWEVLNHHGLVADLMITAPNRPPEGIEALRQLARRFPAVRLVLDHVAYPIPNSTDFGVDAVHASLARYKNIYYKFTTINLDLLREARLSVVDFVRHLVSTYGSDRVLWGSDAGNSGGSYAQLVPRIVASTAKLAEPERHRVLHDVGDHVFVRGGLRRST